jgi:hypothetical protein
MTWRLPALHYVLEFVEYPKDANNDNVGREKKKGVEADLQ